MANSGRHLNTSTRRKSPRKAKAKKHYSQFNWKLNAPLIAAALLVIVLMLSPLRGCTLSGNGYIGKAEAQKIVVQDARVSDKKVKDISTEMIKLDDKACYKIEFTCEGKAYSYIISADKGAVIASTINESGNKK